MNTNLSLASLDNYLSPKNPKCQQEIGGSICYEDGHLISPEYAYTSFSIILEGKQQKFKISHSSQKPLKIHSTAYEESVVCA